MTILTIAGSPSLRSRSSSLLRYASEQLIARGFDIQEAGLYDIPAIELIEGTHTGSAAENWRTLVAQSSAVLIASPVYKASFPGGLKAMLDLLGEKAFADKVVLPIATGGSPAHLLALEYGLKPVLSALGAQHILAGVYATDKQVVLTDAGQIQIDEDLRARLDESVNRLAEHVKALHQSNAAHHYDIGHLALNARFSI